MYQFDKVFLTGCDAVTEWQLPWFIHHYKKFNTTPLVVADFGMTETARSKVNELILPMHTIKEKAWFLKPQSMLLVDSEYTCWLDTDCQVLANLDGIFKYVEDGKLSMVEDKPWTIRRRETWHNSGVVAFKDKPSILKHWAEECKRNPIVGDQETLHLLMTNPIRRLQYINDLPNKFNVLRIQLDDNTAPEEKAVMHWTGRKGKDVIRSMLYE